jgi:hypothetical protein
VGWHQFPQSAKKRENSRNTQPHQATSLLVFTPLFGVFVCTLQMSVDA